MANFAYTKFTELLAKADIDFDTADIRIILVCSGSTAGTEEDKLTISGFTTLNEYNGSGYPTTFATRKALANEAITRDDANDRTEIDADNTVFSALGAAGLGNCIGAIVYKHGTSDADSVPLVWIDTGGFPFNGNGSDVTFQWNAQGIIQIAKA